MTRKIRPIRIEGNIAYVPLTRGLESVIDAIDAPRLGTFNWVAFPSGRTVYAVSRANGLTVYMHREILLPAKKFDVDHIDMDGLNNRRANLREATRSQNMCNRFAAVTSKSGIKGVTWHERSGRWRAQIVFIGKAKHLGLFDTKEEAAAAYARAASEIHGKFARAG